LHIFINFLQSLVRSIALCLILDVVIDTLFFFQLMWVYDDERSQMVQREITYVPGLYKIFDEILGKLQCSYGRVLKTHVMKLS